MTKRVLTMGMFIRKVRTDRMFVVLSVSAKEFIVARLKRNMGAFYLSDISTKFKAKKPEGGCRVCPGDFIYRYDRDSRMKLIKIIKADVAEE